MPFPLSRLARAPALLLALGFAARAPAAPARTIVFFGDSLTAGYGLADPGPQSFPGRVQAKIDAARLPWRVVNAGLSGETSAGGLRRVDWVLAQRPDIFFLELGANDGLRGTAPEATEANLQAIIDRVRARWPAARIVLAGMRLPPSMGEDYAAAFAAVFGRVAARNRIALVPFLLEGVAEDPRYNQGDGVHPNAAGAARVADVVWRTLGPLLSAPG